MVFGFLVGRISISMYLIVDTVFASADGNVPDKVGYNLFEEALPVSPCRHRQWDVSEHRVLPEDVAEEDATP